MLAISRSTSTCSSSPGREQRADELQAAFTEPIEQYLFGRSEASVEEIVLELCRERGLTVATAESCTGGLVAARLTSIPGSSDVFVGGVVSYSNEVKEAELGVPAEVLRRHGAVSAETAAAMARGVRGAARQPTCVSVTGIAGPGGGSDESRSGSCTCTRRARMAISRLDFIVPGDRETVRRRATVAALHLVHKLVTEM